MTNAFFIIVISVSSLCAKIRAAEELSGSPPRSAPGASAVEVASWIAVIANGEAEWTERFDAEARLADAPPERVLPALLVLLTAPPEEGGGDPQSAEANKDAPPDWQAHWSARRAWRAQFRPDRRLDGQALAEWRIASLLPRLYPLAQTLPARLELVQWMGGRWSDPCEPLLAQIFRDDRQPHALRIAAAQILLIHRRDRCFAEIRAAANHSSISDDLIRVLLLDPNVPDPDPLVTVLAFALMERNAHRSASPTTDIAFFRALGAYLKTSFRPIDPAPHASQAWIEQQSRENARRWWRSHGPAIAAEAAKLQPGPT